MKGPCKLYSSIQIYVDRSFQSNVLLLLVPLRTSIVLFNLTLVGPLQPRKRAILLNFVFQGYWMGRPPYTDQGTSILSVSKSMPVPARSPWHMAPCPLEGPSKNGALSSAEPQVGAVNQPLPAPSLSACSSDSSCHSFLCE